MVEGHSVFLRVARGGRGRMQRAPVGTAVTGWQGGTTGRAAGLPEAIMPEPRVRTAGTSRSRTAPSAPTVLRPQGLVGTAAKRLLVNPLGGDLPPAVLDQNTRAQSTWAPPCEAMARRKGNSYAEIAATTGRARGHGEQPAAHVRRRNRGRTGGMSARGFCESPENVDTERAEEGDGGLSPPSSPRAARKCRQRARTPGERSLSMMRAAGLRRRTRGMKPPPGPAAISQMGQSMAASSSATAAPGSSPFSAPTRCPRYQLRGIHPSRARPSSPAVQGSGGAGFRGGVG